MLNVVKHLGAPNFCAGELQKLNKKKKIGTLVQPVKEGEALQVPQTPFHTYRAAFLLCQHDIILFRQALQGVKVQPLHDGCEFPSARLWNKTSRYGF